MKKNVLVFVHGMTTDVAPSDPTQQEGRYDQFWTALQARKSELKDLFPNGPIKVEWGHQLSPNENPVRDDHRLTEVERFVNDQVSYRNLQHHGGPNNIIISDWGIPGIRQVVTNVREGVVSFGLTDVVYYCSDDGETRVRAQVYSQVLLAMQHYLAEPNVKIHLFGHSLGVTIVHDVLGFSSRNLYSPNEAMMDIQVDVGDTPQSAHTGYWKNETVVRETAQLFYDYAS